MPLALDADGAPLKRNFVHVDDLVACMLCALGNPRARQQKFNVCMDEPVDYGQVAEHLRRRRSIPSVVCRTEFHSTWLDNSKAKFALGWRPRYCLRRFLDEAWGTCAAPTSTRRAPPRLAHVCGARRRLALGVACPYIHLH